MTNKPSACSLHPQISRSVVINPGQQFSSPAPGEPEITRLVGMALEQIALRRMDPNSPYGTAGQTVQDRLNEITAQRTQLEQRASRVEAYSTHAAQLRPAAPDN